MDCLAAKGSGCASIYGGFADIIVNTKASATQRLHAPGAIFISPDAIIDLHSKPVAAFARFWRKKAEGWVG
jgi:hypothetical protein